MTTRIRIGQRSIPLPNNPVLRIGIGVLLVLLGFIGFLPVLGFWMVPLGLVVLSVDFPLVRRWRRRATVSVVRFWTQHRDSPEERAIEAWWRVFLAWGPVAAIRRHIVRNGNGKTGG